MGYTKPGVLITQVQESVSPTLITPDLYAAIAGPGYYDVKQGDILITGTNGEAYWNPNSGGLSVNIQTLFSTAFPNVSGIVDYDSVYIDAVAVSGLSSTVGRKHLTYLKTGGSSDTSTDAYYNSGAITLKSSSSVPGSWLSSRFVNYSGLAFRLEIGFRVKRYDIQKTLLFEGGSDIQEAIGPVTVFNPLGTAISLSTANSNRQTYAYGMVGDTSTDHEAVQNSFESVDIYAIAPLTKDFNTNITSWRTHATSLSTPENKKERIVIANASIPWSGTAGSTSSTDKANTASAIYNRSAITAERRLVLTHPDIVYLREKLHISRIKSSYILNTIWEGSSNYSSGLYCLLTDSVLLSDGTKYFKNDQVTDTVWDKLEANGIQELTVLIPVPGYYIAAIIAGQVSGQPPQQGFTNLVINGINRLKYSTDHFSETNLNVMAEGGIFLVVQDNPELPVYCRHQLTTDTTTVETRELSIVKSIDYSAKFLRKNLKPLVGRYNITENFLKRVKIIINGAGLTLVSKGVVKDVKLLSLTQDTTNPDRIKGKIRVMALYPSNYIEIDLIY